MLFRSGFVFANYDDRIPQIEYEIDRDKVKTHGVALSDVFFTLQTFLGGFYINDFNLFGRTFRVQAQAEGTARAYPDDVKRFYVRNSAGAMVPLSALLKPKSINLRLFLSSIKMFSSLMFRWQICMS